MAIEWMNDVGAPAVVAAVNYRVQSKHRHDFRRLSDR